MYEYKGYHIIPVDGFSYRVKTIGRGSLPKTLLGIYTSTSQAKRAIDSVKGQADDKSK